MKTMWLRFKGLFTTAPLLTADETELLDSINDVDWNLSCAPGIGCSARHRASGVSITAHIKGKAGETWVDAWINAAKVRPEFAAAFHRRVVPLCEGAGVDPADVVANALARLK